MKRYSSTYQAFDGKDLSPQGLLEEFNDDNNDDDVVTSVEKDFSNSFLAS